MANVVSMKALLEAGVHFGHQTRRWNPKMAPYIYTERNGIYIVDLQKTVRKLEEAYSFVRELAQNGQTLLFVGTKKQAQDAIREEAQRCGQYYVNARWLGSISKVPSACIAFSWFRRSTRVRMVLKLVIMPPSQRALT